MVYRADQDTDDVFELYSVPVYGGIVTKLNTALVTGGDVTQAFWISLDGDTVVYLADQDTDGKVEAYSVAIDGGMPVKLNGPLPVGGNVITGLVAIPSDGDQFVYLADQEVDEAFELYSVPIGGGAYTKLNDTLVPGGDVDFIYNVSAEGERVTYLADQEVDGLFELYSVSIAGGAPIKVSGERVPGATNISGFSVSSDGTRIVYVAEQDMDDKFELYASVVHIPSMPITNVGISFCLLLLAGTLVVLRMGSTRREGPQSTKP